MVRQMLTAKIYLGIRAYSERPHFALSFSQYRDCIRLFIVYYFIYYLFINIPF